MLALVTNNTEQAASAKIPEIVRLVVPKTRKRKFKNRLKEDEMPHNRLPQPIHESEHSLCVLMWQSAIVQALYDLSGSGHAKLLKTEAHSWFFGTFGNRVNPDFKLVCELAELSEIKVLKMANTVTKFGDKALEGFNFRTIRKDYSNRKPTNRRNKGGI